VCGIALRSQLRQVNPHLTGVINEKRQPGRLVRRFEGFQIRIERRLCVDDHVLAAGQVHDDIRTQTTVGVGCGDRALLVEIAVVDHAGKLDDPFVDELPGSWRAPLFKLVVLLRLATLLHRSRSPSDLPAIALSTGKDSLELKFPQGWLDDNPLSADALDAEADQWKKVGTKLEVSGLSDKKVSVLKQIR